MTDISWTPIFPRAAAVVTDIGAPLSHAAIVARELGIPAVANGEGAGRGARGRWRVCRRGAAGGTAAVAEDGRCAARGRKRDGGCARRRAPKRPHRAPHRSNRRRHLTRCDLGPVKRPKPSLSGRLAAKVICVAVFPLSSGNE